MESLAVLVDEEVFKYLIYGSFAVGGALWTSIKWIAAKVEAITNWIRPKVESFFDSQNELMAAAKESLIENAARVSAIDVKIDKVHDRLSEQSEKLAMIDERTMRLLPGDSRSGDVGK